MVYTHPGPVKKVTYFGFTDSAREAIVVEIVESTITFLFHKWLRVKDHALARFQKYILLFIILSNNYFNTTEVPNFIKLP